MSTPQLPIDKPMSTMSMTFESGTQDDLSQESLMGLQELDTHLSLLDDTSTPGPKEPSHPVLPPKSPITSTPSTKNDIDIQTSIEPSLEEPLLTKSLPTSEPPPTPHISAEERPRKILKTSSKKVMKNGFTDSVQYKMDRATDSMASSMLTALSEVSSAHSPMSSKATPPTDVDSHTGEPRRKSLKASSGSTSPLKITREKFDVRPKASIPSASKLAPEDYARQCIEAAESSRLQPFSLHPEEYELLKKHIGHTQVTTYLNIRNGILRLWVRNSQIVVLRTEAIGCAKDARWFDVANVCYQWLVRRGYINYGCPLEYVESQSPPKRGKSGKRKRKTVAVLGAGMAGLGAARQLESLFSHFADEFRAKGEDPPKVIVLEGRDRIGGRVYSHPLETKPDHTTTLEPEDRATAEMGGMIITGFERGNPLNTIVRAQLALQCHALRSDDTILYDYADGKPVDHDRDQLVEKLYNDVLDRVSDYKYKLPQPHIVEGDQDLIEQGRDATGECTKTLSEAEDFDSPASDRSTGRAHLEYKAAYKASEMGWPLKRGVQLDHDIDLNPAANAKPIATLGSVMDDAIHQYRNIVDLTPLDFRLMNWHIANLEYSNAINYRYLSLGGWDLDNGNEWEGKHSMITGGYQKVPKGLAFSPSPLDVQRNKVVTGIMHNIRSKSGELVGKVEFRDGDVLEADYIVSTLPLGVLKYECPKIQPPLPEWKTGAIARMGYGVLNKVILVYKEAFWDQSRDIFGVLREPINNLLSLDQKDYSPKRGRFFQWLNCTNTSGVPTLIALMAGDAAFQTQASNNASLVDEATRILKTTFGDHVPNPIEVLVTRWGYDPFSRGSYSYAGPEIQADDYDTMAKPVGNLHFAGEHTCAKYPATVHGAYISGLRVASDILDSMIGPIDVPSPLILPRDSLKRKASGMLAKDPKTARIDAYEEEVESAIIAAIGDYPCPPGKVSANPYIFFSKANYEVARQACETGRRPGKRNVKREPNEVRVMLSKMWKETSAEQREPYKQQVADAKKAYEVALKDFKEREPKWDMAATAFKAQYVKDHPRVPGPDEVDDGMVIDDGGGFSRRVKRPSTYAEDNSDEEEDEYE